MTTTPPLWFLGHGFTPRRLLREKWNGGHKPLLSVLPPIATMVTEVTRMCCITGWMLLAFFWAFWVFAFAGWWCGGPC